MINKKVMSGLLFTSALAYISLVIPNIGFLNQLHINSLIIAIILGMIVKNCFNLPSFFEPGINYAFKTILRFAIILLGFKLSLGDVGQIGLKGVFLVILVTGTTLLFATWIGRKMGIDRSLVVLIGAGSSICGASAIAAVAPVIDAKDQDITFAVATVTIFGTLAMFLYPIFYHFFHLPDLLYAVWAGSSIHEVSQVVAAGFAAGEQAGEYATMIKLTRVLLVIPTVLFLGFTTPQKDGGSKFFRKGTFPWFVFGFCGVVLVNSFAWIPAETVASLISIDNFLLTIAMTALGLGSDFNKIKAAGLKPLYAGLCITLFISIISFAVSGLLYV